MFLYYKIVRLFANYGFSAGRNVLNTKSEVRTQRFLITPIPPYFGNSSNIKNIMKNTQIYYVRVHNLSNSDYITDVESIYNLLITKYDNVCLDDRDLSIGRKIKDSWPII